MDSWQEAAGEPSLAFYGELEGGGDWEKRESREMEGTSSLWTEVAAVQLMQVVIWQKPKKKIKGIENIKKQRVVF